jgi:hypothetical protein
MFPPSCDFLGRLLSKEDRLAYLDLQGHFRRLADARPHSGLKEFSDQVGAVHDFICRSPINQSLRAMSCGIFFGPRFILVNTHRFKTMLVRSKSGMNSCFQRLGYDVMRPSNKIVGLFQRLLPCFDPQVFQVNKWCLRIETDTSTLSFKSHIPDPIAATFETDRIVPKQSPVDVFPLDLRLLLNREPPRAAHLSIIHAPRSGFIDLWPQRNELSVATNRRSKGE